MAVKKIVYLEPSQQRLVRQLSAEERTSESEVVRRALELYAREHLKDPLKELIGAFSGGPADGSLQHDRYLVERLQRRRAR